MDKDLANDSSAVGPRASNGTDDRASVRERWISTGKDREQSLRFRRLFDRGFVHDLRLVVGTATDAAMAVLDGFVLPLGDSLIKPDAQGRPAIMSTMAQAAQVIGMGGAISIDFSLLRAAGASAGNLRCKAAGPMAYLGLFDKLRETVQTPYGHPVTFAAVLDVAHPDAEMFASDCVATAIDCCISFSDHLVRERMLWAFIRDLTREGSIALLFPDTANRRNSLRYCEQLHAPIHPGGPLLPFHGATAAGTLMLPSFVTDTTEGAAGFDWTAFGAAVATAVEFLDRALDLTVCPLAEQQVELQNKRRIALSCQDLVPTMTALGIRAGSADGIAFSRRVWSAMRDGAFLRSVELARELGPFPLFNADGYLRRGGFASTLSPQLQAAIHRHGIRNANLLAGTVTVDVDGDCASPDDGLDLLGAIAPLVDGGVCLLLPNLHDDRAHDVAAIVTRAWQAGAGSIRIGKPAVRSGAVF